MKITEKLLDNYRGIRDQDGWETLELTLVDDFEVPMALEIMKILEAEQNEAHSGGQN